MKTIKQYDVIIIGGSYSGLAAAMALGRALRKVLVIDGGRPCNIQTPYSHNFLTQDGKTPNEIALIGKQQVAVYSTVEFVNDTATDGRKSETGFEVRTLAGKIFEASKLIFATGIKDEMPGIKGYAECWGISVLHCPYCHGYEVRNEPTAIVGNGLPGFELAKLISNWTSDLKLFTNGASALTVEQAARLYEHGIQIIENEVQELVNENGKLQHVVFKDGSKTSVKAIYSRPAFKQHCELPAQLGCGLTDEGYIKVDTFQHTTVNSVYACGDNFSRMRTVANAVATGTTAGMMVNKELIEEAFN